MKKLSLCSPVLLLFLLCPLFLSAQKEHAVWHFGSGAGIRFLPDTVISISGGKINSREGCATVAGRNNGALLFYTDGTKVWNRNHAVMPSGSNLKGDYSSAQSALVLPFPNDTNKYYVFTTHTGTGMYYSVVDMSLDGGLGDVVAASKNTLMLNSNESSEKLTGIKHCNDTDFWLVTHLVNGNSYYVYGITSSGISAPSVYSVGSNFNVGGWMEAAQMKISIDGKKLANAIGPVFAGGPSSVEIFDFNNVTGQVSSPTSTLTGFSFAYGIEFSPNGRFLYVTELASGKLDQFDLEASNIAASKTILASSSNLFYGALQLGPDGRIYVSAENGYNVPYRYLSVIRYPDNSGSDCNLIKDHVDLGTNGTLIGLPTLYSSNELIKPNLVGPKVICTGAQSIQYKVKPASGITVSWQIKSSGSTIALSDDSSAIINFRNTEGTDSLILLYTMNCGGKGRLALAISVLESKVFIGNDTAVCFKGPLTLNAGVPNARYKWNGSSTDTFQTFKVTEPGTYYVTVTNLCKSITDSIVISGKEGAAPVIPNTFSPNADNVNDFYPSEPGSSNGFTSYRLEIYNRWGELLFETETDGIVWNGKYNNREVPEGIYFFTMEYSDCTGKRIKKNGVIHLLR